MNRKSTVNSVFDTPLAGQIKATPGCRLNRTNVMLVLAWLVMIAVLVPCNSGSSQPTQVPESITTAPAEMPALDGATLLDTRCSACHSADKPKHEKETHEQWEKIVTRMIGKGAKLNDAEKKVLVDYLAKTYGP
ncbi:MAG: hypothetical protein C4518_20165 [Desulfobacteraceae bacterium]|nr:MAG: hypothetical protein C4518_20165 [Desulfobacteraceae bacterium]